MPLPPDMAAAIHHQQQQQQQQAQQQHVPGAGMVNSSLALKHPGMSPFLDDQGLLTYTADPTKVGCRF
jgi:3-mercaptopyruvate sulfurtransferase SseA